MLKVKTLVLGPVSTNCYILYDEQTREALVIDPAANCGVILTEIERLNVRVKAILLTHTHFDHMEALDELAEKTGAPLFCPAKDERGLSDFMFNGSMLFFRYPVLVKTKPARLLVEGDEIALADETIKVIETPGHTIGSVCYDTGTMLFTGDTLFCGGCGRTDLPGGDCITLSDSIKRILSLGERTVYPGHSESTTLKNERNSYL